METLFKDTFVVCIYSPVNITILYLINLYISPQDISIHWYIHIPILCHA